MDYKVSKIIKREEIRTLSKVIRTLFGYNEYEEVDPVYMLEIFSDIFKGTIINILPDEEMPPKIPARCYQNDDFTYTIEIKESVYDGARKEKIGGYRMHIMHEMSHVIFFQLGFTPLFERTYSNRELKPYESAEWQAKSLSGEIMIPHDYISDYDVEEIASKYGVSIDAATFAKKI